VQEDVNQRCGGRKRQ